MESFKQMYRGVGIYRHHVSGMYSALGNNGSLRADTLAGIKQLITESFNVRKAVKQAIRKRRQSPRH